MADEEGVEIAASSPGDSAGTVRAITDEIVRVREQFRADDDENAMRDVYRAIDAKRPSDTRKTNAFAPLCRRHHARAQGRAIFTAPCGPYATKPRAIARRAHVGSS